MSLNAKSKADMRTLAQALALAPHASRPAIAANLVAEGLMIPRQWWVRLIMWTAKRRHGLDDFAAWAMICTRKPEIADDFLAQTIEWVLTGKDASGQGVGGFDQREVNIVADMLARIVLEADALVSGSSTGGVGR